MVILSFNSLLESIFEDKDLPCGLNFLVKLVKIMRIVFEL